VLGAAGDPDRLSSDDVLAITALLLLAGTETTTKLLGNAVLLLTRNVDLQVSLRANKELIPQFVEEMLRYDSSLQRRSRTTTRDTQIGGLPVPKGARIQLLVGSANRDPEKFSEPDQFQVGRKLNRHLAFGSGPHFCLGAHLARLEAAIAIETMIERMPQFVLARPDAPTDFGTSFMVRGPIRLDLVFPPPGTLALRCNELSKEVR
jgi:cytochrome P450